MFFLPLLTLPSRIIDGGRTWLLQKLTRLPFRLRGNSRQFYPTQEGLDELVFLSLSLLFSKKRQESVIGIKSCVSEGLGLEQYHIELVHGGMAAYRACV